MKCSYSLEFILEIIGSDVTVKGDFIGNVEGFASLADAIEGDLSFFYLEKYKEDLLKTRASVVLVPKDSGYSPAKGQTFLYVENPSLDLAKICRAIEFDLIPKPKPGIHPSAFVHPSAKISSDAYIGPLCCIEEDAQIGAASLASQVTIGQRAKVGDGTIIFPQVTVGSYCVVGDKNRLLEGCVIGSDGFGYIKFEGKHERLPQVGIVETAAEVDIGANSTIDRARMGQTYIGEGTKIDNLVQIAHNVKIGKYCLLVSQSGIAGSSILEDNVIVAGKSGVSGHLTIGANSTIGAASIAIDSLEANSHVLGFPAQPKAVFWRLFSLKQKLPDLFKRFKNL
ncbi:MAG: UDP-3-O-acylglucosamine N-acyltransferase [Puniceicoccaceae bacterium MED-G32]|nr:MAG: UDP-3-O-acylglucosamine N-acyltransferase [Puniceicoccaceae bacterium MED-G32]